MAYPGPPNALSLPGPLTGQNNALLADAWDANRQAYADWQARDRAEQVRLGNVDPVTGQFTPQGWQAQAQTIAGGFGPADIGMAGGLMGAIERAKMKPGPVEIPHPMRDETVSAYINPSRSDLARMMQASSAPHLRVLQEGPNVAVWPALDATHGQMRDPLGFSKDAKLQDYRFRIGDPNEEFPHQAGRFSFWVAEH